MNERRVEITEGLTGKKVGTTLLLCPECNGETFLAYFPDGITHSHFQCTTCNTTFCDGCEDEGEAPSRICSVCACTEYDACACPTDATGRTPRKRSAPPASICRKPNARRRREQARMYLRDRDPYPRRLTC